VPQVLDDDMKQVDEDVSQQLMPPFVAAGQLFWQSESCVHEPGQAVPPPPPELEEVPEPGLPEDALP
jgi:hypothetical protein